MIDEVHDAWGALHQALTHGPGPGAGVFAYLAGLALVVALLFRPQIGRLLDRTVYLRAFGIRLLAMPTPDREKTTEGSTRPEEPPKPPPAPGA